MLHFLLDVSGILVAHVAEGRPIGNAVKGVGVVIDHLISRGL